MVRFSFQKIENLTRARRATQYRVACRNVFAALALSIECSLAPGRVYAQEVESGTRSAAATDGVVHVPFTLYDGGMIVVDAQIDGRTIRCQLDTGSQNIMWPASLKFPGKNFAKRHLFGGHRDTYQENDVSGISHEMLAVELPSLRLGGFEAKNVKTFSVDLSEVIRESRPEQLFWRSLTLLSDSLFEGRVLSIDYEHRELQIYPPDYDPATASARTQGKFDPAEPGTQVVDFQLASGHPVIAGSLDGIPARIGIDTGWCTAAIGLSPDFFDKIKARREEGSTSPAPEIKSDQTGLLSSTVHVRTFANVAITINPAAPNGAQYAVFTDGGRSENLFDGTDALIGWDFLRHFRRLTLDFPHNKLYFEPWPAGSPGDRTGVFAGSPMAKSTDRRQLAAAYGLPTSVRDLLFGTPSSSDSSSRYMWIQWQGGKFGDLWDDGTFIPLTPIPSSVPPITDARQRGFVVNNGVTYSFRGDNTLSQVLPADASPTARAAHDLPPALGTVYKGDMPFVVLSDGTMTSLMAHAPEIPPASMALAAATAPTSSTIPGKHWNWTYPFTWVLVANDVNPAPWPAGKGQGPGSSKYWSWAEPGQWVALPDGTSPPLWGAQSAASAKPPLIPPPPPGGIAVNSVWRFYYKVGWTQVPTPSADAANGGPITIPSVPMQAETCWQVFSGGHYGLLPVASSSGPAAAPPPPAASPAGLLWYYYANLGWALVPFPASPAVPPT